MGKRGRESTIDKTRCLAFVRRLWDEDKLGMFHHPVSASELPDYHTVIKCPVDLSTIRRGIEAGAYDSDVDVQTAVAQMITNALEYNAKGTEWHRQALLFRRTYLELAQRCGMAVDADAAYIPSEAFEDNESTLRKEERRNKEDLDSVLKQLEEEKEVSLEELMAKYRRNVDGTAKKADGDDEDGSEDDEEDTDEEEDDDGDGDTDEEDDSDEEEDSEGDSDASGSGDDEEDES